MKITKTKLRNLIKESWASYGVDPVQFLIDFFQGQDILMGSEQVEYLLSKEGYLPGEIDVALNDPRLDDYYEEGDDSWGISEVPYAPPQGTFAGGPRSGGDVKHSNRMRETDGKSKRAGGGQTWSDEEPEGDELNEAKMKITKRQLRRIIQEEKARLLQEESVDAFVYNQANAQAIELIEDLLNENGSDPDVIKSIMQGIEDAMNMVKNDSRLMQ